MPARSTASSNGLHGYQAVFPCGIREDQHRVEAPYLCILAHQGESWPVNGTARRSPFFVSWKVIPRFRSTSGQRSESNSPPSARSEP